MRPALTASLVGLAAGVAYPFIELGIACLEPASEACVWGKAYLPLSLAVEIPVVGSIVAAIVYAFISPERKRRRRPSAD